MEIASERDRGDHVVELRVRDEGTGIPQEAFRRLFEPFFQVNPTFDRRAGGLGVGLALVKSLVELHGGSVSASSPGEGMGAEFVVRLPARRAAPPSPADWPAR